MRNVLIILLFCCVGCFLNAQSIDRLSGPRAYALGGAGVAISDGWSGLNNQAGIAGMKKFSVAAASYKAFNISDLNAGFVTMAIPIQEQTCIGISASQLQMSGIYARLQSSLALAKSFNNKLKVGLQFNYVRINMMNYGQRGYLVPEMGFIFKPSSKIETGFHLYNPFGKKLTTNGNERLPLVGRAGFVFHFSKGLLLSTEVETDLEDYTRLKSGIEYQVNDNIALRLGISGLPVETFTGLSVQLKRIRIWVSLGFHPYLGPSPYLGMEYVGSEN